MKKAVFVAAVFVLSLPMLIFADVKYETSSSMEFAGTFGKMMKLFGSGKPVRTVDYYKGDLKRSDSFDNKGKLESSQIVDLDKELFITLMHDKKEYSQMTFDEWKKMIQSSMEQATAESSQEKSEETQAEEEPQAEVNWDVKVDVKETGEKEEIAGKPTEKVVLTLDIDAEVTSTEGEEGQAPETTKGGMVVTSSQWLYNGGDQAKKEMDDFNLKFAQKIGFAPDDVNFKEMMSQVLEENSQLGEAMKKMQEEGEKLQGMAMRAETLYETKVDPETLKKMEEEKANEEKEEKTEIPTSVGGLIGGFGKKIAKKQFEKKEEGPKERNQLMTSKTDVLEFSTTSLDASLFTVPSNYKLVENKTNE